MNKKLLTSKERGAAIRKGIRKAQAAKKKAKAGKSQWAKMTPQQKELKIKQLNAGRRAKRNASFNAIVAKHSYKKKALDNVVIDLGNIKITTTRKEVLAKFA